MNVYTRSVCTYTYKYIHRESSVDVAAAVCSAGCMTWPRLRVPTYRALGVRYGNIGATTVGWRCEPAPHVRFPRAIDTGAVCSQLFTVSVHIRATASGIDYRYVCGTAVYSCTECVSQNLGNTFGKHTSRLDEPRARGSNGISCNTGCMRGIDGGDALVSRCEGRCVCITRFVCRPLNANHVDCG